MRIATILSFVFTLFAFGTFGQDRSTFSHKVRGTLKDSSGAVLAGLRITTPLQAWGTATNINGDFSIDLPAGDHVLTIIPTEIYGFRAFLKITPQGPNPDNVPFIIDRSKVCCVTSLGVRFPRPIVLPRPPYPAAARAVRATGEVVVALRIDKEGKVISAKALNGHPLLRAAAETIARRAEFEPGAQAERELNLTYVFIADNDKPREGVIRYTDPWRVEVIAEPLMINAN